MGIEVLSDSKRIFDLFSSLKGYQLLHTVIHALVLTKKYVPYCSNKLVANVLRITLTLQGMTSIGKIGRLHINYHKKSMEYFFKNQNYSRFFMDY